MAGTPDSEGSAELKEWLDWLNKLSTQFPSRGRYLVLYTKSATYLTGCVLDKKDEPRFQVGEQIVEVAGVVVDHTTYWIGTDEEEEAYFLVAWLNSPAVDRAIKPSQTVGLFGARDIHKRPVELPLPRYDAALAMHRNLARLGVRAKEAAEEAAKSLPPLKSIATLRAYVRKDPAVAKLLAHIAKETEKLVPEIAAP